MGLLEIIILAVVQGITEFLPISSSGHLRAAAEILGIPGSTLAIDVAVHVGTLGAVIIYFCRDIARILVGVAQYTNPRPPPKVLARWPIMSESLNVSFSHWKKNMGNINKLGAKYER